MRVTIARVLGLAAFVAAARAAWLHHCDNQLVIRTDLMRESFAAGQAAERTRAADEAGTARRARYLAPPVPDWLHPPDSHEFLAAYQEEVAGALREGPPELAEGWTVVQDDGPPPTVTFLPPGLEESDFVERDLGDDREGERPWPW
jgi:hypothetical protein